MVKTGARAAVLLDALIASGLEPVAGPPRPRIDDLPDATAGEVLDLYHALGGAQDAPNLRPGSWDLSFSDGLVVELDEELHFNRYRATTLATSWEATLPWAAEYLGFCSAHEPECLLAGAWGKRWTNDSAGRMFSGGPTGDLDGDGAPRWKQRAMYDALKDTAPLLPGGLRLARVATHHDVEGTLLGSMLDGFARVDPDAVRALVDSRTV